MAIKGKTPSKKAATAAKTPSKKATAVKTPSKKVASAVKTPSKKASPEGKPKTRAMAAKNSSKSPVKVVKTPAKKASKATKTPAKQNSETVAMDSSSAESPMPVNVKTPAKKPAKSSKTSAKKPATITSAVEVRAAEMPASEVSDGAREDPVITLSKGQVLLHETMIAALFGIKSSRQLEEFNIIDPRLERIENDNYCMFLISTDVAGEEVLASPLEIVLIRHTAEQTPDSAGSTLRLDKCLNPCFQSGAFSDAKERLIEAGMERDIAFNLPLTIMFLPHEVRRLQYTNRYINSILCSIVVSSRYEAAKSRYYDDLIIHNGLLLDDCVREQKATAIDVNVLADRQDTTDAKMKVLCGSVAALAFCGLYAALEGCRAFFSSV